MSSTARRSRDFYRQAADKYVEIGNAASEGRSRGNLGDTLRKLRRLDEARREIRRAIECGAQFGHASSPCVSWSNSLTSRRTPATPLPPAEARTKAIAGYLAYRRDVRESFGLGRLCFAVTQTLLAGDPATAASSSGTGSRLEAAGFGGFIRALQAIVTGSRDRSLADAPDLDFRWPRNPVLDRDTGED